LFYHYKESLNHTRTLLNAYIKLILSFNFFKRKMEIWTINYRNRSLIFWQISLKLIICLLFSCLLQCIQLKTYFCFKIIFYVISQLLTIFRLYKFLNWQILHRVRIFKVIFQSILKLFISNLLLLLFNSLNNIFMFFYAYLNELKRNQKN